MALSITERVYWRGVLLDRRSAAAMDDLAAAVKPWVQPTQGSFRPTTNYSADTHGGAGAIDISVIGWTRADENDYIRTARAMGWAAWVRPFIAGLWPRHIHMILIPPSGNRRNDGGLSPGAFQQVRDYYNGLNGLANRGADDGPRVTIRTYEQWLTTEGTKALNLIERITSMYKNRDEFEEALRDNAEIGANRALWTPAIPGNKGKDEWGNTPKDLMARTAYRLGEVIKRQGQILTRLSNLEKKVK